MDIREWKEEYMVNLEKIDEYHQKFLDILNMLIKIKNERSCEEEISLVFFRLIYYMENYFIEEETYMKDYKYPGFKQHKEAHNNFIHEIIKFQELYQKADKTVCNRLFDYLQTWFDEHILGEDRKAAGFLIEKGVR
ncbi:MAG: bacteriohemerythrin [Bacteroidales bacterium]|nr:bacteriohemerythrin [Bacteroidales bacterium]MCF8456513.1 bacteriohemerythrin [Bacteroidales bacterium]